MSSAHKSEYPHGIALFIIVATAITGALLELIDITIVNVALKEISGSIGATRTEIAWVITAYAISNVIIIPLTAMLSNLFGRKIYFTFSILLFTVSSLLCGLSTNLWMLVAFRFLQGIGGGALLSTSQTIILESFPPHKAAIGTAIFGMGVVLGPALGPTLGGIIIDSLPWQWIFFVNIPIGILAAILSSLYVSDQKGARKPKSIDWTGIGLLIIGVGSLQYILEEGGSMDWFASKEITVMFCVAILGLVSFIIWELTTTRPAVNLRLMKSPNLSIGMMLNFIIGVIMMSTLFSFPLLAQASLGWTATMSGLALMPGSFLTAFVMAFTGRMISKGVNAKIFLVCGTCVVSTFCFLLYFQSPETNMHSTFIPLLLRGLGMGMLMVPIIAVSTAGLKGSDLTQGAGLGNMLRQLGGAIGVAFMNIYIDKRVEVHKNALMSFVNSFSETTTSMIDGLTKKFMATGFSTDEATAMAYNIINMSVNRQAQLIAYLDSFLIASITALAALPFILMMKTKKSAPVDSSMAH